MKCFECGDTLNTAGRCVNIDCSEFWQLADEFDNVRELDFDNDPADKWGLDPVEWTIEDDYPEDYEDEEDLETVQE